MKDPTKLQQKLESLSSKDLGLSIICVHFPEHWDESDLDAAAWMVQNYVDRNDDVIEDSNALRDWLDEYKFFRADRKVR